MEQRNKKMGGRRTMRAGNAGSSLNYIPAPSRGWGGQSWPRDYVSCLSCYGRIWIRPFLCRSCCVHPPTPFLIAAFVGFNCWQAVRSEHAEADPSGFAARTGKGRARLLEGSWGPARSSWGIPGGFGGLAPVSHQPSAVPLLSPSCRGEGRAAGPRAHVGSE